MKIILGSQSRGRKTILEEMGIDFEVIPSNIDERAIRCSDPKELVLALAHAKADALLSRIAEPALLITSDQVVVCDGVIREKPENEKEAREFLESYNTLPAEMVTSVVVTNIETKKRVDAVDVAKVCFSSFSTSQIDDLISKGDLFHFAGGFSVRGDDWVESIDHIDGAIDSVLGLPKDITKRLMREACELL